MKKKFLTLLAFVGMNVMSGSAFAAPYNVWGTTISIYAQSAPESDAHMISSSKPIFNGTNHPWCANRAYIDINDKALYATALAFAASGKPVNFTYDDAKPLRTVHVHQYNFGCKVISIWN
jgi:hypothetical protein